MIYIRSVSYWTYIRYRVFKVSIFVLNIIVTVNNVPFKFSPEVF